MELRDNFVKVLKYIYTASKVLVPATSPSRRMKNKEARHAG